MPWIWQNKEMVPKALFFCLKGEQSSTHFCNKSVKSDSHLYSVNILYLKVLNESLKRDGVMDTFFLSRILTGLTFGFHIIFVTVGVGIPLMLVITEGLGIRKKDPHYILLARRWSRGLAIIVAIGVVTSTIIWVKLSLLWPSFMRMAGHAISLPLFLETFAFFIEAIFLGIYIITWDRLKPFYHWLLGLPVIVGSSLSAVFMTTVNAFMNTPTGFSLENGVLSNVQPLQVMFNPATPTKVFHVLISAYLTAAFILAGIAAFRILQGKTHIYYQKSLKLCLLVGMILSLLTGIAGVFSAKFLANYQPEKLAAAQGNSIHYLFNGMVGIGVYLVLISLLFGAMMFFRTDIKKHKWLLGLVVLGGPLSLLAIEFGWVFTEMGRQPWLIRGFMLNESGVTTSNGVGVVLLLFILLYLFLGTLATQALLQIFRSYPAEKEMEQRGIGC